MLSVYYSLTPWQHFQNIAFRQKRHIYLSQTFHGEHIHFLWKQKFYESMSTTSDCSKLLLIKYYFIDFTGKYFMMIFLDCQRQTVSSWSPFEFITNKKCFRNIYAPLVQNLKSLLICIRHGCNLCTKFGIDQVKGSKDIEQTTHWARKSGLTLTFEHVTLKSIGIIYSLRAIPAPNLVLIEWRSQKILSGQHSVLRSVVWPWPLNMWPENK